MSNRLEVRQRKLNFFVVPAVRRIISGQSVVKIIKTLRFRTGTAKN